VHTKALGQARLAQGSPQALLGRVAGTVAQPEDAKTTGNRTTGNRTTTSVFIHIGADGSACSPDMPVSARTA
jgi:hypothetical protein